jgi:hypothetical protein
MAAVRRLLKEMETRTLVWLAKSRMSSVVIVGTLAVAGLGAGTLSVQSRTAVPHMQPNTSATPPLSAYGCYNDPDGDGHIFCDGTVAIAQLPASFGQCQVAEFDNVQIVCKGTGTDW